MRSYYFLLVALFGLYSLIPFSSFGGEININNAQSYSEKMNSCSTIGGLMAQYDFETDSCKCILDSYEIRNGSCQPKAYSTYANVLNATKSDIQLGFTDGYMLDRVAKITLKNCSNLTYLKGSRVVLNLMYDKELSYGDYMIIADKTVCQVSGFEMISTDLTVANLYCKYENGQDYRYSLASHSCIKDKAITTVKSCKKGELKRNGKCVKASTLK